MTGDGGYGDDRLAALLTRALEREAASIEVPDAWDKIRPRLVVSPVDGNVVPSTFALLGTATASTNRAARLIITQLDTGVIVADEQVAGPPKQQEAVDVTKILTLEPGRYRAVLTGIDDKPYLYQITFTVVP
jgi:hypothetical protein